MATSVQILIIICVTLVAIVAIGSFSGNKESETKQKDLDNRFTYHSPNEITQKKYERIRNMGKCMAETVEELCPDSREKSLALTKIEEASMWANAAIARNE